MVFKVLITCFSSMPSNLHTALNCMHLLGHLLKNHNPHKPLFCLSSYAGNPCRELIVVPVAKKKREIPCAENVCEVSPTWSDTLKFLSLHSLLFSPDFRAWHTEMVYPEVPQSWGSPSTSKIPFIGNPHFSIFMHRVRYLKNLSVPQR